MRDSLLALLAVTVWLIGAPVLAGPQDEVLNLVNQHRARAGCPALRLNAALTAAAKVHSAAMAEQNFFAHEAPDGTGMTDRLRDAGYSYQRAGENIFVGAKTASNAVAGWMKSSGHRANILDCRFTETGIAMTYQPDDAAFPGNSVPYYRYWVQDFGRP